MDSITINPQNLWIPKFDDIFYESMNHKAGLRNYVLPGGRGSTKSSFIGIEIPLILISNRDVHAAVFRKIGNTLKTSVVAQIQWGISELGLDSYFITHVNPMEIIYKPTGQKILFFGLDDPGKTKSVKLPFGYIGVTWFEELDQFSGEREVRKTLQSTQRGGGKFWNFMSFNPPISANNWANEYVETMERTRKHDTRVVRSTYLDVPVDWLGEAFIDEAEYLKTHNRRAYDNEMMGIPVGSGGNIFPNVENLTMSKEMIGQFDNIFNGLDWGFANDPNAYVKMHYSRNEHSLYIFGEHHAKRESNRVLFENLYVSPSYLKYKVIEDDVLGYEMSPFMDLTELLTADSAEPKSIADLKSYGAYVRGMVKYPDSVRYGIKWLQSLAHIYIDKERCPNTYREFSRYEYERDRYGNIVSGYPDEDNHHIDAVRYGMNRYYKKKGN